MSKLTLDEAIKHCLEVAERKEMESGFETDYACYAMTDKEREECKECAADHRQLAEWLTDYKELKNSIGAIKLSNMKEAHALIKTLKAELNGWKENPFSIIAEVCRSRTDCIRCQWNEKCPFSKKKTKYESYPDEWLD